MSHIYIGTRAVLSGETGFNEVFVSRDEEGVFKKMRSFAKDSVKDFINESIEDPEGIISMTYMGEVESDENFLNKVENIREMPLSDIMQELSDRDILTIYANLYDDEEIIVVSQYSEEGEENFALLSNETI